MNARYARYAGHTRTARLFVADTTCGFRYTLTKLQAINNF